MKSIFFCIIFVLSSFANEWKIQNDPYYKHKVTQFEILKNDTHSSFMMLGDSITDEAQWSELLNMLVYNRGISGDTTSGVLDRLEASTAKGVKKVFIMIGVNDIMRGKNEDEVFSNYKKIVKFFLDKNIEVIIQSTLYIGESRKQDFNEKIENLNLKLSNFSKEKNLVFIDLNKYLSTDKVLNKEYSFDDLHLNAKAYTIWVNILKKYLNNYSF